MYFAFLAEMPSAEFGTEDAAPSKAVAAKVEKGEEKKEENKDVDEMHLDVDKKNLNVDDDDDDSNDGHDEEEEQVEDTHEPLVRTTTEAETSKG